MFLKLRRLAFYRNKFLKISKSNQFRENPGWKDQFVFTDKSAGELLFLIEGRKDWLDRNFKILWCQRFLACPDFNLDGDFANDFVLNCYYKALEDKVDSF